MPQTTPMAPVEQLDPFFATQVGNGHLAKGVICFVSQGMTQWPFLTCMVVQRVFPLHIEPGGHSTHAQVSFAGFSSSRYCVFGSQSSGNFQVGFSHPFLFEFGVLPDGQDSHFVWPRRSTKVFSRHLEHTPGALPYRPRSHPSQTAAPVVEVVKPGAHCWHWVASSSPCRAYPTGQC